MPGGKIDILVEPDLKGFPGKLQAGLQASSGAAAAAGRGIGLAITAGLAGAAIAFKEIISIGNEYQGTLNEIQAVTGSTGDVMAQVADKAKQLGSDTTLAGVSAADAAGAMLELAKGGLTVDEAMAAAQGTLQLAGAAQIDGARAAEIQAQALNQFGLAATDAGRVADTLANTANAASGSIEDVALAMKYVGPVAASMSVSMEDTAAAIGLLANNGILADTAGTSLRGMLASLAAPSGPAKKAIRQLGIEAFDSTGKFVGFRSIIEQLTAAQGRMTEAQFTAAAATAFGREPLAAITALAREGGPAFDQMRLAVGRQGGAAEVAAAKMQGLGGAMESFRSNLETVAISIYELIDGPLEALVRTGTAGLDALNDGLSALGSGNIGSIPGVQLAVDLFGNLRGVLDNVRRAAEPVVTGVRSVVESLTRGGGAASTFGNVLRLVGDAAQYASGLLVPVGQIVGGLLSLFSDLPGPIQTAALAFLAWKTLPGLLSGVTSGLRGTKLEADGAGRSVEGLGRQSGGAVAGLRQFSGEMRVQRALAAASGQEIGRLASVSAAFETSTVGAVAGLRSFRDEVRAIRDGAAGAGQPISTLGAAMQALAARSPAIAGMAGAFNAANSAVTSFADSAAAAARRAAEGLGPGIVSAVNSTVTAVRNLPSAAAGAVTALGTGLANAARTAGDGLRAIPGHVATAATSLGSGLANAARTAGDAFRAIPGTVSAAMTAAGNAVRQFPTAVGTAFRAIPGAIETGISALGRFAGAATGIGAGAFSGLMRAGGSLISFLGGPWGVALAAAGVALSILGQRHEEAKRKAEEQKAAMEALRGTLDQNTGAITRATIAEKAQQLAKDGTLQSVRDLGISTNDYVRAALGEEGALQRVRTQLDSHTQSVIAASREYQTLQGPLAQAGITMGDFVAAANGSEQATNKIRTAIDGLPDATGRANGMFQQMFGRLLDNSGASAQLARDLGITNGELTKIQEQTRLASEATGDFTQKLDLVKDAVGGIATGAPQTERLRTALAGVATAAGEAATAAGKVQADLGGVAAGGAAAAKSMQQSRDAFVSATEGALGSRDAAEALADQLGLIPSAARIIFETNATGATAEVITLQQTFASVPDAKSIDVQVLSQAAEANLSALGLRIERMKDGTVTVHADTAQAKANLDAFVAGVQAAKADVQVGAQTMPAQAALGAILSQIQSGAATVTINGQSMPAQAALSLVLGMINGSNGTVTINGNKVPADQVLSAYIAAVNSGSGTVTLNGNKVPADQVLAALVAAVTGSKPSITINSNAGQVNNDINNAARDRTATITVRTISATGQFKNERGMTGLAAGGIVSAMHDGGVVGFAGGGTAGRKLRPMRGGFAQVVPPNTWRVVGDRLRDDEAYIPINGSGRSRRIFEETARRMGYAVTRMYADGGIAAQALRTAGDIAARASLTGGGAAVVGQLAALRTQLGGVERSITVNMTSVNPQAEPTSTTTIRRLRDLKETGLFGG